MKIKKVKANDLINILENLLLTFVSFFKTQPIGWVFYYIIFDFVTYSLYICVYEKVLFLDFDGVMFRPEWGGRLIKQSLE
jgi:hypothetical protein